MSIDYRWVIRGVLAGGEHPGRSVPEAVGLANLRRNGVRAVLTLTEEPLDEAAVEAADMNTRHIPVADFGTPSLAQLSEGVAYIRERAADDEPVYVHCWAGIGRDRHVPGGVSGVDRDRRGRGGNVGPGAAAGSGGDRRATRSATAVRGSRPARTRRLI